MGAILGLALFRPESAHTFQGSTIDPPTPAANFSLTSHNGEVYRLEDQRGKVLLLFFGYTNCPDVCPTTLAEFSQIRQKLGERAGEVEFLFLTVDPKRDTVQRLKDYLPVFGGGITGLTGNQSEMEAVWQAYGVFRAEVDGDSPAGYLMDHSSRVYAIDRQGRIRVTYMFASTPEAMYQDILYLLDEN
jgi:protein SCO1/2